MRTVLVLIVGLAAATSAGQPVMPDAPIHGAGCSGWAIVHCSC